MSNAATASLFPDSRVEVIAGGENLGSYGLLARIEEAALIFGHGFSAKPKFPRGPRIGRNDGILSEYPD
jgi:hypothetical protein